jgi:hypothetical protein
MCSQESLSLLRLQVAADVDATALARVIHCFQNLNIVPRRVIAEFGTNDILHITVDIFGVPDAQVALIANKIRQSTSVLNTHWYRV